MTNIYKQNFHNNLELFCAFFKPLENSQSTEKAASKYLVPFQFWIFI
jgi:hypothetical protein